MDHNSKSKFDAKRDDDIKKGMDHDDAASDVGCDDSLKSLLERVAQLLFDQQIVATNHDCSTTGEISVKKIKES